MMQKCFTVYDAKAEAFLLPFFAVTEGFAVRQFRDLLRDRSHMFRKYPADFTLYYLGDWDDLSAVFTQDREPKTLGTGADHLKDMELENDA